MRLGFLLLVLVVGCRSSAPPPAVPPTPRAPNPDTTTVAVTPAACEPLERSAPTTACAPQILATPGGPVTRVWRTPCHVHDLRNDGAVGVAHEGGYYTIHGEPPVVHAALKSRADGTIAGSSAFELIIRQSGTQLVSEGGARCEMLPLAVDQHVIAGRSDGHVFFWGHDDARARHLVERTVDAQWKISPAIPDRGNLVTTLWAHAGRVVAGYQTMTAGADAEMGYYDPPTNQLRPIRRGVASLQQLLPGVAVDEPPTALYMDGDTVVVDQPDVVEGYRRLERVLPHQQCPVPEVVDPRHVPSGKFRKRGNAILFRTMAGGLWLAYTDVAGRCSYRIASTSALERVLIARPPPRPPTWNVSHVVERTELVLVPVERGRWGTERRTRLPPVELHYAGPWQFHPSVTAARVRLVIGAMAIDIDPNKLSAVPPLRKPWVAPEPAPTPTVETVATPVADAPPFPALRSGPLATPVTISTTPERTLTAGNATCRIVGRSASKVEHQLVLRCDQARALGHAADGARAVFTQFSQRGYEPLVEIDARGEVHLRPQPARAFDQQVRFERGAIELGPKLPRGAPPTPPGWTIHEHDAQSVFATSHDRGYELLRGTVSGTTWDWKPAFATGRTPPQGPLFWPVFLRRAGSDPIVVYVGDPRIKADITIRTRAGAIVALPTWGKGRQSDYRVNELAAVEIAGPLPVVAAKVDRSIVLAYPSSPTSYHMRALAGVEAFPELPPATSGEACAPRIVEREREELYSPQLFVHDQVVGLAHLSTRVRERSRWTRVAPGCGWVIDQHTVTNELVVARVDTQGTIVEKLRVPVEYRGGTGFHGANLLVDIHGKLLHAIATSYGLTTYTRIDLSAL